MRAITRVPEPPVEPITNGGEWVTPTLATAKPDEQYPVLRDSLSRLGRGVGRSAASCIRESQLPPHPIFVITDAATDVTGLPAGIEVVRRDCHLSGKARKTEFFNCLPEEIETALLLDADTRVIGDISLGFEKAEQHGIAI